MKLTDFKILDRKGEDFRLAFTEGIVVSGELVVETPKRKLHLTAHYLPLPDENGEIHEVLGVYFDITTIRELEQKLQKSIDEIAGTLSALANKNLSVSAPIYKDDPLIGVKTDLNSSIQAIHDVLSEILSQIKSLTQSIEDISRATVDLTKGSEQVALTSQQASQEISDQLKELDRVSNEITDLSASIEEISASAQDVRKLIAHIASNGNQAVLQGEEATEKMKIVEKISRDATDQMAILNNRMNEVGKIVQMIGDIANQTNLLALNAAIEAARAGEHGRGFAVVAGEVKNLAGESKLAAGKIGELITTLMRESETTAESMKNAFESIISGSSSVGNALSSLNQMAKDIEIAESNVTEITRATENQAEATNRVTQNVGAIQQMVEGEEQKMTGFAAVAQQSSASTEEIASAAGEISDMAKELKKEVESFSL
jgi:methyl-accepting chemotaxis protein